MDPVRPGEDYIEIDQDKNQYPFIRVQRGIIEETGKPAYIFIIDSNKGGQVVGEGVGIGVLVLKQKRLRALRDWLCEQDLGDTF